VGEAIFVTVEFDGNFYQEEDISVRASHLVYTTL
jgi:hypothetical protein